MIKVIIVFCTDKKYPHFFGLGGQTISRGWPTSLNIRPHRAHFFKAKHIYCNNTKKSMYSNCQLIFLSSADLLDEELYGSTKCRPTTSKEADTL